MGEQTLSALSEKSTLEELFKVVTPEDGINAVPVTMKSTPDDKAQLMIVIAGEPNMANLIMAQLMTAVNDLHERMVQQESTLSEDDDGENVKTTRIIS